MKISNFFQNLFNLAGVEELNSDTLKIPIIREALLKCEEFEGVKQLFIMDTPTQEIKIEGKNAVCHSATMKIGDGLKFKSDSVYLYSIFLSPAVMDKKELLSPVKNGVSVSPVYHDLETFLPMQTICVARNLSEGNTETEKSYLVEEFKKALDNPKDYLIKQKKAVLIRGYFPEGSVDNHKSQERIVISCENGVLEHTTEIVDTSKGQYVIV